MPLFPEPNRRHHGGVDSQTQIASVRVSADVPLLRTGLEAAARTSGFRVIREGCPDVWLVGPGTVRRDGAPQICVGPEGVEVRLSRPAGQDVWRELGTLVRQLLDRPGDPA